MALLGSLGKARAGDLREQGAGEGAADMSAHQARAIALLIVSPFYLAPAALIGIWLAWSYL
jgi:hypothetical protein